MKRLAVYILLALCMTCTVPKYVHAASSTNLGQVGLVPEHADSVSGNYDTTQRTAQVDLVTTDPSGNKFKTKGNIEVYFPMYETVHATATSVHSVNAEVAKTQPVYFMPMKDDFPTNLKDMVRDPDRDGANRITYVYDGDFDQEVTYLTPEKTNDVYNLRTSKQVYSNFGTARVLELCGYDILLAEEKCDMVFDGDQLKANYKTTSAYSQSNNPITTNTAVMDIYKALGQEQWDVKIAYCKDDTLNNDDSPIWNEVNTLMDNTRLDVSHGKCWVFATRTNPAQYWDMAQADQIFGQSHLIPTNGTGYTGEASSVTFTKGQNSTMTMGEFLATARAMMELYGEEVVTGEMQDDIVKAYGFALPEGQSAEISDAVRYMTAKGIINPTEIDYSKEITFTDIEDILVRIADKGSRLSYPKINQASNELTDNGFVEYDDDGVSDLEDMDEITNVDTNLYYDYFVEATGYTSFLKSKSDKNGKKGQIMTEDFAIANVNVKNKDDEGVVTEETRPVKAGELIGDITTDGYEIPFTKGDNKTKKSIKLGKQALFEYAGETQIDDKNYYHFRIFRGLKPNDGDCYYLTYKSDYTVKIDAKLYETGSEGSGSETFDWGSHEIKLDDSYDIGKDIDSAGDAKIESSKDTVDLKPYLTTNPTVPIPYGGGIYNVTGTNKTVKDLAGSNLKLVHYSLDGYIYSKLDISKASDIKDTEDESTGGSNKKKGLSGWINLKDSEDPDKEESYAGMTHPNSLKSSLSTKYLDNPRRAAAYKQAYDCESDESHKPIWGNVYTNGSQADLDYANAAADDSAPATTSAAVESATRFLASSLSNLLACNITIPNAQRLAPTIGETGVMFQASLKTLRDKGNVFKWNDQSLQEMVNAFTSDPNVGSTVSPVLDGYNIKFTIQSVAGSGDKALLTIIVSGCDYTTFKKCFKAPTRGVIKNKSNAVFYYNTETNEAYVSSQSLANAEIIYENVSDSNGALRLKTKAGSEVVIVNGDGHTNGYTIVGETMHVFDTNFVGYMETGSEYYINVKACTTWASKLCYLATADGKMSLVIPQHTIAKSHQAKQVLADGTQLPIWLRDNKICLETTNPTANYLCVVTQDHTGDGVYHWYPKTSDITGDTGAISNWNSLNVGKMPNMKEDYYFLRYTPLQHKSKAATNYKFIGKVVKDVAGNKYDKMGQYFYVPKRKNTSPESVVKDSAQLPYVRGESGTLNYVLINAVKIGDTLQKYGMEPSAGVMNAADAKGGSLAQYKIESGKPKWVIPSSGATYAEDAKIAIINAPMNVWGSTHKKLKEISRAKVKKANAFTLFGNHSVTFKSSRVYYGNITLSTQSKMIMSYDLNSTKKVYTAVPTFEESALGANGSDKSALIGDAKPQVDWDQFTYVRLLKKYDLMTSVLLIFCLNLLPRLCVFGVILLIIFAVMADMPPFQIFCDKWFDPIKILTLGAQNVHTIQWKVTVWYSFWEIVILYIILDGNFINAISWILQFIQAIQR